jgi:hypothetical protein
VNATILSPPKTTTVFDPNGWRYDQMPARTSPPGSLLELPAGCHPPSNDHDRRDRRKGRRTMTYCLAMRLQDGLVFLPDTRTSADPESRDA